MTRAVGVAIRAAAIAAVAIGLACFGSAGKKRVMSPAEQRAGSIGIAWAKLPAATRQALDRGDVWLGATEAEAWVARGEPRLWWNSYMQERWCRVLVHTGRDVDHTDTSIMTCDGVVVAVTAIAPALPCWRLAEVGPRIVAAADYFDRLGIERQWQVVAGILERGQDEQDVVIALGTPYSRGFDEREDGTRADQLVFLDHGGDSYGLSTTLIKGKLAGWRVPAERKLTPEAEQRRLDAMEKRLTAKMEELDANAQRRHAETIQLFNEVMEKQDVMLAALTAPPPMPAGTAGGGGGGGGAGGGGAGGGGAIDGGGAGGGGGGGGGGGVVGPNVTGQTELTINDCSYTDTPQGSLGVTCGGDSGVGCPASYTCLVMGADVSSTGLCVPQSQSDACSKKKGMKTIGGKCKRDRDCDGPWEGFECKRGKGEKHGYCVER